jgi:sialic acid synthase SpsE
MNSTHSSNLYVDLSHIQSRSPDELQSQIETFQESPADGLVLDLYRTEQLVSSVYSLDEARTRREYQLDREDFLSLHQTLRTDSFEVLARVYDPELVRWYAEETTSDRILTHGGDITFKRLLETMNQTDLEVLLTAKASQLDTVERAQTWLSDTETTLVHEEYENEPETLERYNILRSRFGERIGLADPSGFLDRTDSFPVHSPSCWITRPAHPDQNDETLEQLARINEQFNQTQSNGEPSTTNDKSISFAERDHEYRQNSRRSLMASQSLSAGSVLSRDMVRELRPGDGLPAEEIDNVIGMLIPRPTDPQEMISY